MVARLAVESVAVVVVKHGNDVEVRAVEAVGRGRREDWESHV